jgi:hypothetical protein
MSQTETRAERGQKKAQHRVSRRAQRDAAAHLEQQLRSLMANAKRPPATPPQFAPFLRACPKLRAHLDDPHFAASLTRIANEASTAIRSVQDWAPQGKSAQSLHRSLCAHLFARYPMPPFLWSLFGEEQLTFNVLAPVVLDVARGGSLYTHVKDGKLAVPFTRKMCHDFMRSSSELSVIQAIRKVQVAAAGGGALLFQALAGTRWGLTLLAPDEERFFAQVVEWVARQPMLSLSEAGPIFDYLAYRFGQDDSYSMKGRSPLALLEAMKEWHQDATLIRAGRNTAFPSFGVPGAVYDESVEGTLNSDNYFCRSATTTFAGSSRPDGG